MSEILATKALRCVAVLSASLFTVGAIKQVLTAIGFDVGTGYVLALIPVSFLYWRAVDPLMLREQELREDLQLARELADSGRKIKDDWARLDAINGRGVNIR